LRESVGQLEAVHDDLDAVLLLLLELVLARIVGGHLAHLAVDPRPHEALLGRVLDDLLVLPLLRPYDRGEDLELRAQGPGEDRVEYLVDALLA
jgi:hypothetical protein